MPIPRKLSPADWGLAPEESEQDSVESEQDSVEPEAIVDLLLRFFSPEDISKIPGLNINFQSWDEGPPDTIGREEFGGLPEEMQSYLTERAQQSKGRPPYERWREYAQEEPDYQEEGLDFPHVEEKDRVSYIRTKGRNPVGFVDNTYHMPPEVVEEQKRKKGFNPTSKDSLRNNLVKQLSKKFDSMKEEAKKRKQKEEIIRKYKEEVKMKQRLAEESYVPPSPLKSTTYPSLPDYILEGLGSAREKQRKERSNPLYKSPSPLRRTTYPQAGY